MASWRSAALVFLLALLVHARSLGFGFLDFDDPHFILAPEVVRAPSVAAIGETLTRPVWGSYHPLHILSYAVDSALWGMERPGGFHATNIVLFALCAALLVHVARSYGCTERGAALAGVLYAVHPSHVESVAWLTGRKDVLSGVFVLLTLLARRRTGLALFLFLLALASKTTAAALGPFLLVDAWLARRLDRRELERLIPFLALAGLWLAIEHRAQTGVGGAKAMHGGSIVDQLRVVLCALAWYPVRFLWWLPLTPRPVLALAPLRAAAVLAITLAPALLGAWGASPPRPPRVLAASRLRRGLRPLHPQMARAVAFFFLALAPVSNVVPIANEIQDRYLFLPSMAAACLAGALLARRRAFVVLVALLAATQARETWRYTAAWRSDEALWTQALAADPRSPFAHLGLAAALGKDRSDEALAAVRRAVACGGGALALGAEARLLEARGDRAGAIAALESAWRASGEPSAATALVRLQVQEGLLERAKAVLHDLEGRAPKSAHRARAYVLQAEKDLPGAVREYWEAEPELEAHDWLTLAALERVSGHDDRARVALAHALRADATIRERLATDATLGPLLR